MSDLNDCFSSVNGRLTVAEALERFTSGISAVVATESVPLSKANGRIISSDVKSKKIVPPRDNSAVDGYLVFFDDLSLTGNTTLPVTGRITAGNPFNRSARRGEALSIFTGAQIPYGEGEQNPDTIFMIEDIIRDGNKVTFPSGQIRGSNLRMAGEDINIGDIVLKCGQKLRPQDVGILAAVGLHSVKVRKRLKVALFSTGDELREPGDVLQEGAIYDINRFSIQALLRDIGCQIVDLGILKDSFSTIEDALMEAAKENDLVITSGGVSRGEEDHVRKAVESLGQLHTWNLLIKPGRPIALGHILDGIRQVPFIGLPGNPVAVLVTFLRIARPIILLLSGASNFVSNTFEVVSGFDYTKKPGRREWLRAKLERGDGDILRAVKYPHDGSGILSSLVYSDGLVELSEKVTKVNVGEKIQYLPFSGFE
ncbi:MAG: gephyrin-like molybdotransferase Glp [Pseudomonadota bacterium]|nr:gephyrin-like molybdotransferase Glp [Pseudomonadota bacterium]